MNVLCKVKYYILHHKPLNNKNITLYIFISIEMLGQSHIEEFIENVRNNGMKSQQSHICDFIKWLAGDRFFYSDKGSKKILHCFTGTYWCNDDVYLRKFISNDLYDYIDNLLSNIHYNMRDIHTVKLQLKKLHDIRYKQSIIGTYKETNINNNIEFDNKWYLFGFNNKVYDLEEECFRDYQLSDYVSITTGYDWIEPTDEEVATVNKFIEQVMPIEDERKLYLQTLCTALEGRTLDRYVIFNGNDSYGKEMVNNLLLNAFGNYGLMAKNSLLYKEYKSESNPDIIGLHKKRLVIYREPPSRKKLNNSIMKKFITDEVYHGTMIIECNDKPRFVERNDDMIDVIFRAKSTDNETLVDESNYIYKEKYRFIEFQKKYKCALLKILFDEHKKYKENNYKLLF